MNQLLKSVYHTLSGFQIVRDLGQMYRNGFPIGNFSAYLRMRELSRRHKNPGEKITIVFYGQCMTCWNKVSRVVQEAMADERFRVFILAIPDDVTKTGEDNYGELSSQYGSMVINAQQRDGWFSLEGLKPDYVFFQRPYDSYLPACYRSKTVSRYAKICYIDYCFSFSEIFPLIFPRIFFRNVYFFFAEADYYAKYNESRMKISHRKGYRKTLCLGYPSFQDFMCKKPSDLGENHPFQIVWTPRWSEDAEVGGSNFFPYKDKIVEYVEKNPECALTFRPHPMLFSHFLQVGRMTQQEMESYLAHFQNPAKMKYDKEKDYSDNFWKSDVLVTDLSGVLIEYFLTGKPIIYCPSSLKVNPFMEDIFSVLYIARTWEEVEARLTQLAAGIDPYKEEREKKAAALAGEYWNISKNILDAIADDCFAS